MSFLGDVFSDIGDVAGWASGYSEVKEVGTVAYNDINWAGDKVKGLLTQDPPANLNANGDAIPTYDQAIEQFRAAGIPASDWGQAYLRVKYGYRPTNPDFGSLPKDAALQGAQSRAAAGMGIMGLFGGGLQFGAFPTLSGSAMAPTGGRGRLELGGEGGTPTIPAGVPYSMPPLPTLDLAEQSPQIPGMR